MKPLNPAFLGLIAVLVGAMSLAEVARALDPHSVRYMAPRNAKCFLSREQNLVRGWLKSLPGSPEERAVIRRGRIGIDTCFGINSDGSRYFASYDYAKTRAGLVRAILQRHRDKIPQQVPANFVASNWYVGDSQGSDAGILATKVSVCLLNRDWGAVRNILVAVDLKYEGRYDLPKGAIEREIRAVDVEIEKLIAVLPACVPAASKLTIARSGLRNLIEEAALHAIGLDALLQDSGATDKEKIDA